MAGRKVNWAVVGIGDIVRKRVAPALLQQPDSNLYACMTRNPSEKNDDLKTLNPEKVYTDFEKMIADPKIDAVYLATPVYLHAPQTIAAIQAGKDVLVEKPMALNSSETEAMCLAAEKANRRLAVAYYRRYFDRFQLVKDMIEQGDFGQIVLVRMMFNEWYGLDASESMDWRVDPKLSGGGVLMDVGSHRLDLLAWWFGLPEKIVAEIRSQTHNIEVDDSASILGVFSNGTPFTASFNWNSKVGGDEIQILGTKAEVILSPCDGPEMEIKTENTAKSRLMPKLANAHYPLIDDFTEAILQDHSPRFSGRDGLKATKIMTAAYESSNSNSWIRLI